MRSCVLLFPPSGSCFPLTSLSVHPAGTQLLSLIPSPPSSFASFHPLLLLHSPLLLPPFCLRSCTSPSLSAFALPFISLSLLRSTFQTEAVRTSGPDRLSSFLRLALVTLLSPCSYSFILHSSCVPACCLLRPLCPGQVSGACARAQRHPSLFSVPLFFSLLPSPFSF